MAENNTKKTVSTSTVVIIVLSVSMNKFFGLFKLFKKYSVFTLSGKFLFR